MSKYGNFLKGKRVVLVGPASTLRGKATGEFIDSHDVVVRVNHAWPLPEQYAADIGTRTDVIYHNLSLTHSKLRKKDIPRMVEDGVLWLVSTHPLNNPSRGKRLRPRHFLRLNKGRIRFRTLSMKFRHKIRKKVGGPNAGLLAMVDLLRHDIQSLYVTGFSFYTTGYLEYPGYRKISPKMSFRWHNQRRHKSFIARLLRKKKRLEVDPVMQNLLCEHVKRQKKKAKKKAKNRSKKRSHSPPRRRIRRYVRRRTFRRRRRRR